MRVAVNSHALPIYKKNRIASLLCIFETTIRQFDIRETPFMNKYGNTNSFIQIFGSGHFSGREVRGKSSSVTTHRIPRNENAIVYEFAIIQCPI